MSSRIAILAAVLAVAVAIAIAARPHDPTAAERVDRITAELRCPVCQGLSVKDSGSETARQMRDLVAQRVAEGRSDSEILAEFRASYGDWILLSPPLSSWSLLIWLVPVAALAAGLWIARSRIRSGAVLAPPPSPSELASLRERVAAEEAAEG